MRSHIFLTFLPVNDFYCIILEFFWEISQVAVAIFT